MLRPPWSRSTGRGNRADGTPLLITVYFTFTEYCITRRQDTYQTTFLLRATSAMASVTDSLTVQHLTIVLLVVIPAGLSESWRRRNRWATAAAADSAKRHVRETVRGPPPRRRRRSRARLRNPPGRPSHVVAVVERRRPGPSASAAARAPSPPLPPRERRR